MNIFDFRDRLVGDYANYVRSFIAIQDDRIQERVKTELAEGTMRCGTSEILASLGEKTMPNVSYIAPTNHVPNPNTHTPKKRVGILAFGSLVHNPGPEIQAKIATRIKTNTPFPVEYGRYSAKTRCGAPTLVPHPQGSPVAAEILVLDDDVTVEEATNMLWQRETGKIGTSETYTQGTSLSR